MGEPVSQYGDILAEASPETPQIMRQAWHYIATGLGADALFLRKVRAVATVAKIHIAVAICRDTRRRAEATGQSRERSRGFDIIGAGLCHRDFKAAHVQAAGARRLRSGSAAKLLRARQREVS
jgi:hypothetical protein